MNTGTLIIGNSACAATIAERLLEGGNPVILLTRDETFQFSLEENQPGKVQWLPETHICNCFGGVGQFNLSLETSGQKNDVTVGTVIVAENAVREPNFQKYGITPSSEIISISTLNGFLNGKEDSEKPFFRAGNVVFLNGVADESLPFVTREVMQAALALQTDKKMQAYIFTRNLKVAGEGLEKLYRKAREAGVVFFKFSQNAPDIQLADDGAVSFTFTDEISNESFRLTPDRIVVDESVRPSDYLDELATVFHLHRDPAGFLQSDNVHRLSVLSNRNGILVAGGSRGYGDPETAATDAANAVIATTLTNGQPPVDPGLQAKINIGQCVKCLTCLRSCPYQAVILNTRPFILPEACNRCGICVAACPREAIDLPELETKKILDQLRTFRSRFETGSDAPHIAAFCCVRSAFPAGESARLRKQPLPEALQIIEVPCGGGISIELILKVMEQGADGVLVLTCHEGNCHSQHGNLNARRNVDQLRELLPKIGIDPARLSFQTLASNMGKAFSEIVDTFALKLENLNGPSVPK